MRDIAPPPPDAYVEGAALLPLSMDRTLVFLSDDAGKKAHVFWLDMNNALTPSSRTAIVTGGSIYSILHLEIIPLPDMNAAVLLYTDSINDGDGVGTTGELRYRSIDLLAPVDQPALLGPIQTAVALSGTAVATNVNNKFNL